MFVVLSRDKAKLSNRRVRRNRWQVLHALAAAQRTAGFRHRDLRLSNIMEHHAGDAPEECVFKVIDLGHATVHCPAR